MFELHKIVPQNDPYTNLRDILLDFRNTYHFDIIKAMHFTQDKDHPYVRISCKLEHRANYVEYNYMLNIEQFDQSYFRLMREEKKAIIYSAGAGEEKPDCVPFDGNAKLEIYYPLFNGGNEEVIGCIYLSSLYEIKFNRERFLADYRLNVINYMISMLYNDTKKSSRILSFLKLFDDFLLKNNSHMLRHHYNVAYWTMKVADELDMSFHDKTDLYFASLLHDIGEIYINGDILNKKEKLTEKEYLIEQNHVVYGANLVKEILANEGNCPLISEMIMQHHERYDGKGYPNKLNGKETLLQSRIICVADAVDSMLSMRSYKASKSLDETIQDLKANRGTQFDPDIVDIMIKVLYERSAAKLNIKSIPILVSTLNIATKDGSRLIQGTLISKDTFYEFHPNYSSDLDLVEWAEPAQLTLFYVVNQDILEYKASLLKLKDGILYLSDLESTYSMLSYSLLWELEGLLYINESTFVQIKGTRISGDALSFLAAEEVADTIKTNKKYNICLYFDNDDPETIPGKVTQRFKTGNDYLFFFSFEGLREAAKERVIRRIVRKQADLKINFLFDSNQ